jgi:hypothetical protein
MPKTTHVQVAKQCRAIAKAYEGLADVFMKSLNGEESAQRLIDEANAGRINFWGPVSPKFLGKIYSTDSSLTVFRTAIVA